MPIVKNIDQLDTVIQPYIIKAMEMTRDQIFDVIWQKTNDYYNEPVFDTLRNPDPAEPEYYDRTGNLMNSLTASHVSSSGGGYYCTVGWDDDYLAFRYQKVSGLQVLQSFNSAKHGLNVEGEHNYWDEAMTELGGKTGIIKLFKQNLKASGLPVK